MLGKETEQPGRRRREPRVRITIVEDVAAKTNIARTIPLAATMRKKIQNRSDEARYEGPYLDKFNLSTPALTSGRRSRRQTKCQRLLIIDDDIFVDEEYYYQNPDSIY